MKKEIFAVLKITLLVCTILFFGSSSIAQVAGDFQTKNSTGNWSDYNSWNIYSGGTWVAATSGQTPFVTLSGGYTTVPSVYIKSGSVITVDVATAACFNLIFEDNNASDNVTVSANQVLSIYGNIDCNGTNTIPFQNWGGGTAKIIFKLFVDAIYTSGLDNRTINNAGNNVNLYNVIIDKEYYRNFSFPSSTITFSSIIINRGDLILAGTNLQAANTSSFITLETSGSQAGYIPANGYPANYTYPWAKLFTNGNSQIHTAAGDPIALTLNGNTSLYSANVETYLYTTHATGLKFSTVIVQNKVYTTFRVLDCVGNISVRDDIVLKDGGFFTNHYQNFIAPSTTHLLGGTVSYQKNDPSYAIPTSSDQYVMAVPYGNVEFFKPGNKIATGNFSTGVSSPATSGVDGDITIGASTTVFKLLNYTASIWNVWNNLGTTANFDEGTSKVHFWGTGYPAIKVAGGGGEDFYKLYKSNTGYLTQICEIRVANEYNMSAGDWQTTQSYPTIANSLKSTTASTLLNISGGNLYLGKTGVIVPEFTNTTYNITGGYIAFDGDGAQTIRGRTYNNIGIARFNNDGVSGSPLKTLPNAADGDLVLNGDFIRKNATFDAQNGRVVFSSSTKAQAYFEDYSVDAAVRSDFYNLTNNNTFSSGLTINSENGNKNIAILNELKLNSNSNLFFHYSTDIILRSTSSNTAHIADMGNPITQTINYSRNDRRFVIERYLPGYKSWRFLATPLVISTSPYVAQSWRENVSALSSTGYGTAITGPSGPNAELDYYTQRGSMKYYNASSNTWVELTNTTTTKIANDMGYMLFVRGDRGAANTTTGAGTATNLRIKGQIRTGNQVFSSAVGNFQSIGNPFASQINFTSITKTNIVDGFIVWNPSLAGLYGVGGYQNYMKNGSTGGLYRLNGVAAGAALSTIESGQAFFIQKNTTGSFGITIAESDKGTSSSLVSRNNATNSIENPTIEVSLFTKDSSNNSIEVDAVSTIFSNTFSSSLDNNDMVKFTNTYDNLVLLSNTKNLVVDSRPMATINDTIKLGLTGTRVADYSFKINAFLLENSNLQPYLVDKFLQTATALSLQDSTVVNFAITTDAASKATDRFIIVFKQNPTNFTNIAAVRNSDNTVTINWGVQTEANINNYSIEQSNDGSNFAQIKTQTPTANNGGNANYSIIDATASKAANWYRVKYTNITGNIKYTSIAMVNAVATNFASNLSEIKIYDNPITNGKLNIFFNNQPEGKYNIKIFNSIGQQIISNNVNISNSNFLYNINLSNHLLSSGNYNVVITPSTGLKSSLKFIVP